MTHSRVKLSCWDQLTGFYPIRLCPSPCEWAQGHFRQHQKYQTRHCRCGIRSVARPPSVLQAFSSRTLPVGETSLPLA
eukprot:1332826-Karenia_brevis.AAC.1